MKRFRSSLAGAAIGALPGVVLFLIAQFVIEGEMQLTIGAPAIIIAIAGAAAGAVFGFIRSPDKDTRMRQ